MVKKRIRVICGVLAVYHYVILLKGVIMGKNKHIVLMLEYDMGDYSDMEEDGLEIPTDPKEYEDSFYQSDALIHDMKIVGTKLVIK